MCLSPVQFHNSTQHPSICTYNRLHPNHFPTSSLRSTLFKYTQSATRHDYIKIYLSLSTHIEMFSPYLSVHNSTNYLILYQCSMVFATNILSQRHHLSCKLSLFSKKKMLDLGQSRKFLGTKIQEKTGNLSKKVNFDSAPSPLMSTSFLLYRHYSQSHIVTNTATISQFLNLPGLSESIILKKMRQQKRPNSFHSLAGLLSKLPRHSPASRSFLAFMNCLLFYCR